ncbi:MAG: regulatory protein RecX [Acidobacteria bacterium]|nr:regulatory protein RecX [Acidobacteriota bacterium]
MDAYTTALRLLSRRELTTAELRTRLLDRGCSEPDVDTVIGRLLADRTLDDRRAAVAIARTHALVKARGRLRIERELQARGVDPDTARAALDEVFAELSEPELLERALRKRVRSGRIRDQAQFRRLYAYLVRLGYPTDKVVGLLKKHIKADVD